MGTLKYDGLVVCVGCEYYSSSNNYLQANDYVKIYDNYKVCKDTPNGTEAQMGSIALQDKYYETAGDLLHLMMSQGTIQLDSYDCVIMDRDDIIEHTDIKENKAIDGIVKYADDKMALIYIGSFELDEDEEECEECDTPITVVSVCNYDNLSIGSHLEDFIAKEPIERLIIGKKPVEREEKKVMDNLFGSLGFGKLGGDRFKLSMNGIAVAQRGTNKYVVYNKDSNEFVDATNSVFDIKDALFILPTVEVKVGDTVIHEDKPYFIVDATNEIKAVSYDDCTQTVLIPKSTMFGIKYFSKVFSLFGDNFASNGELFSNPMMLMALMGEGKDNDISKLLLLSSLSKGDMASNPMLMATLLKGDSKLDLSSIMLMSMMGNGNNPFAPKKTKASNKE